MSKLVIPSIVATSGGGGGPTDGANKSLSNLNATGEAHFLKGDQLKTVNGNNLVGTGNIDIKTYNSFPDDFETTTEEFLTFEQFVYNIRHSSGASQGMAYVGEIYDLCLPWVGEGNAECTVIYITNNDAILTVSSSDTVPYYWTYNTASSLGSTPDYKWKYNILQVTAMPDTARPNTIVQYVGETTSDYIQGYFYKCNMLPTTPRTYEWVQINVSSGAAYNAGTGIDITNNTITATVENDIITDATANNLVPVAGKIYVFDEIPALTISSYTNSYDSSTIYFKSGSTPTVITLPNNIKWLNDSEPTLEANKEYILDITNGYAISSAGGILNYNNLNNQPKINNVTLIGNKTGLDLQLAIVLEASSNTTVNGYQVPTLTSAQITQAYNGLVAGKQVIITDATGNMHFTVNQADIISEEPIISFEYFDIMELTYLTDGTIEYRTHNNQITLTQAQYDALTTYADHTDYRIIEE